MTCLLRWRKAWGLTSYTGAYGVTQPLDQMHTNPFDDDKLREECGVFGVIGTADAANFTALGLHALQHRGQEAGGIVTHD